MSRTLLIFLWRSTSILAKPPLLPLQCLLPPKTRLNGTAWCSLMFVAKGTSFASYAHLRAPIYFTALLIMFLTSAVTSYMKSMLDHKQEKFFAKENFLPFASALESCASSALLHASSRIDRFFAILSTPIATFMSTLSIVIDSPYFHLAMVFADETIILLLIIFLATHASCGLMACPIYLV